MKQVKVGSRESTLAVIQAKEVIKAIEIENPDIQCTLVTMSSQGDKDHSKALDQFKSATLFTNVLDEALAKGSIDIAVHSFKDLPIGDNDNFPIVAMGKRENPFDCLVLPEIDRDKASTFGCSCKRRQLQFELLFPHWKTETIRGSVVSRVEQMDAGDYDGLILAVAGLKRLNMENRISHIFTLDQMVPSACQGIIAVQGKKETDYSYLSGYHHEETKLSSIAERSFVRVLNTDGSSYNNGVYAQVKNGEMNITGMYILPNDKLITRSISGNPQDGLKLGIRLAELLLEQEEKEWAK